MLDNFGQQKSQIGKYLGISVFDATTDPSLGLVSDMINTSTREALSRFNFRQLESAMLYPFFHTISGVQGFQLSGVSTTPLAGSGIVANFPNQPNPFTPQSAMNLLIGETYFEGSYSGISFVGTDILGNTYSGISTQGSGITSNVQTMGYTYQLPPEVDQIIAITIPQNALKLLFIPNYDVLRTLPNSILTASGTPSYYTEFAGMSQVGNTKAIQFFPQPTTIPFSGQTFRIDFKRMHEDMINDTDVQRVLPEQYQDIIIWASLEKIYMYLSDDKTAYYKAKKEERMADLEVWAGNQLDYIYQIRDGAFLGSSMSAYMTSILFRI